MKKKWKQTRKSLLLGLSLLFLTACSALKLEPSPYKKTELDQNSAIHFETAEKRFSVSPETIDVKVTNQTAEEIAYGIDFILEKKEKEEWKKVRPKEEMAFIAIAKILEPGEMATDTISLEFYSKLPAGEYRVVRPIGGDVCTAPFTID